MKREQQEQIAPGGKRAELDDLYRQWRETVAETAVKIAEFRARELVLIEELRRETGAAVAPAADLPEQVVMPPPHAQATAPKRKRKRAPVAPVKRGPGRPREISHPLAAHVPGGNVAAFAVSEGLEWSRVYGWGRGDVLGRQIPEYWAKKWEKRFGIPLDAWPKGVRSAK